MTVAVDATADATATPAASGGDELAEVMEAEEEVFAHSTADGTTNRNPRCVVRN